MASSKNKISQRARKGVDKKQREEKAREECTVMYNFNSDTYFYCIGGDMEKGDVLDDRQVFVADRKKQKPYDHVDLSQKEYVCALFVLFILFGKLEIL